MFATRIFQLLILSTILAMPSFAEDLPSWKAFPSVLAKEIALENENIRATLAGGKQESVPWKDIQEVRIVTTDKGPFEEDVFWAFLHDGGKRVLRVPGTLVDDPTFKLLTSRLVGFDFRAFTESMSSVENAEFLVWKR